MVLLTHLLCLFKSGYLVRNPVLISFITKRMTGKCAEVSSILACNDFDIVRCILWDEIVVNMDGGWSKLTMDNKCIPKKDLKFVGLNGILWL